MTDEHGNVGIGEATLDLHEVAVITLINQLARSLVGKSIDAISDVIFEFGLTDAFSGLVHAAALSGIEQALWDLLGQRIDTPVHVMLGTVQPRPLRAYANLNRALLSDRSPSAFGSLAGKAVEAGYGAVKCAPFDDVVRANLEDRAVRRQVEISLERVAAVRAAIGDSIDLMVDCHYRFTARSAVQVIDRLGQWEPYWVEAPVAEHRLGEWSDVRSRTTLQLAGGEMMTGLGRFAQFIDASGVDIVMPDIKYVGGVAGLRSVASLAASRGIRLAPHNPSGPAATIATLHATSGLSNVVNLEHAFGECDWRSSLVGEAELLVDGHLMPPAGPGFGFNLNTEVEHAHQSLAAGVPNAKVRQ